MPMFDSSRIPIAALLLLGLSVVNAQEGGPAAADEEAAPADFVQKGQIVPVSEEDIDEGSDDYAVPQGSDKDLLEDEFLLFKELMSENVYDEADTVAKRVVELAIQTHGPQSNQFAKALTNLAIVQFHTEQYDASVQNFEAAMAALSSVTIRRSARLWPAAVRRSTSVSPERNG